MIAWLLRPVPTWLVLVALAAAVYISWRVVSRILVPMIGSATANIIGEISALRNELRTRERR